MNMNQFGGTRDTHLILQENDLHLFKYIGRVLFG